MFLQVLDPHEGLVAKVTLDLGDRIAVLRSGGEGQLGPVRTSGNWGREAGVCVWDGADMGVYPVLG